MRMLLLYFSLFGLLAFGVLILTSYLVLGWAIKGPAVLASWVSGRILSKSLGDRHTYPRRS